MKSLLNNLQSLTGRRTARLFVFLFAGLLLAALATTAWRAASAGAFSQFGGSEQARRSQLLEQMAPRARPATIVAVSPKAATATASFAAITVNTLVDENNTGPDCSLREAITAANTDAAFGGCAAGAGADTISFSVAGTINLTGALSNLSSAVTINGPAGGITVRRDTGGDYRLFNITAGAIVTLSDLTVTNGRFTDGAGNGSNTRQGAGIFNAGTLTLTGVTVSGNHTGTPGGGGAAVNTYQGAGIYNSGTLSATNSTISGNTTGTGGGNSNNTLQGGGIYNASGATLTLTNATISNNNGGTTGIGGTNNVAGGGIFNAGTATLKNTIVAGNLCSTHLDVSGAFSSNGNNLIGRNDGSTGFTNGVNGDLVGSNASPLDARLGLLANNGGPTATHAFLCVGSPSPAINAGNATGAPATDQRGLTRPANVTVDIGAFELQASETCTAPTITAGAALTRTRGDAGTVSTVATVSDTQTANGDLIVTATSVPSGITITSLTNTSGTVTANVAASMTATLGANLIGLTVTDGTGLTMTANLTVNVQNPALRTYTVNNLGDTSDAAIGNGACDDGSGNCTLRAAIQEANTYANNLINFSVNGVINLTGALPDITAEVPINGPTAGITVRRDTGGNYRIFTVASGATLNLTNLTVTNGLLTGTLIQGAGLRNSGTLVLTGSTISGNTLTATSGVGTTAQGAAVYNTGTLTATNSTISGNTLTGANGSGTTSLGAGVYNNGGTVTLLNTTIANNTLTGGSSATANNHGGGVYTTGGTVNAKNTIIAHNTVNNASGHDVSGAFTSQGNNLIGRNDDSTGFTNGVNGDLVGSNATPLDARLGFLTNNGGPTATHAFVCSGSPSPAINAGNNTGAPATDQRSLTRPVGGTVDIGAFERQASDTCTAPGIVAGAAIARTRGAAGSTATLATVSDNENAAGSLLVTAAPAFGLTVTGITNTGGTITATVTALTSAMLGANNVVLTVTDGSGLMATANFTVNVSAGAASTFTINSLGDMPDVSAGDNLCADSGGNCTLRAAIQEANTHTENTINFSVNGTINLTSALPDLMTAMIFNGPAAGVTVRRDTGGNYRVLNIASLGNATLINLTITNGQLTGTVGASATNDLRGAGIRNEGGLTLTNSTVSGNTINGSGGAGSNNTHLGGGVYNGGALTLNNSTISGNSLGGAGGAGAVNTFRGAGFYNAGTLGSVNSTVSNNSITGGAGLSTNILEGGGGYAGSGTASVRNTIVAGNTASGAADVGGAFNSLGFNVIGKSDGSTGFTHGVNGDKVGTNATPLNAQLGPLASNGGPTQTHALLCTNSPAVDAGDNANVAATDQRGLTRVVNGTVDIGAFEVQAGTCTPPSITAAAALTRERGVAGTVSAIATVSDGQDAAGSLVVTALPPTGITVTSITNTTGNVTANVAAALATPTGAYTVPLTVTDSSALTATANLTVNVVNPTARVYTVNTLGDLPDANVGNGLCADSGGNCSLRAALQEAATFANNTINFSVNGTINLTGALPNLATDVAINGPASGISVRRDTGGDYRIFNIVSGANITLADLTLTNGRLLDGAGNGTNTRQGGGIFNAGTLNLTGVTLSGNSTGTPGGGASAVNTYHGAGIYNTGTLSAINSTISGNTIGIGGGNSNNTLHGGGIYNASGATLTLTNVTITNNNGGTNGLGGSAVNNVKGGGIFNAGAATLKNTIVAGNLCSTHLDVSGAFSSNSNNLIGRNDGSTGFTHGAGGDKVGSDAAPLSAQLIPLANNGGPTQTHAFLCSGSPALDAGNNTGAPATDQRGLPRPVGGTVDIGAFEQQSSACPPPSITAMGVTRSQGAAASTSQIATVSDGQDLPASLVVTISSDGVNFGASATLNGVTVSGISVDTNGNATASVAATCVATNAAFTLKVTNSISASAMATLNVTVTANTAPTVGVYANTTIAPGGNTMVTPGAAPADNGSIMSVTASAPGFSGTFSGNTTTGALTITNANPPGSYTVTVVVTDNCGSTTQRSFTLTVNTAPTISAAAGVTRQQGSAASNSQIATALDGEDAETALVVTVDGSAMSTVNGVTVSGLAVNAMGQVTANVVASCTATSANFALTVTDTIGATANATLTVTVTANSAPTVGTYADTIVAPGGGVTVTPTSAPTDNGSIASVTATAAPAGFTGTFSGNATTGAIMISNANPVGVYTVTVTLTDNCNATTTRTFTLDVNACGATLSKPDASFAATSNSDSFTVTISAGCTWTAVSNNPDWITVTAPSGAFTGPGTVSYNVTANPSNTARRIGTITVAGQTFTVLQGPQFLDVPTDHSFYTFIGKLGARGVTLGCGGGNYCPTDNVSRQQMAAFLIRALGDFNPPPPAMQRFADVPSSNGFYAFIEQMAVRQITLGCGGGNYCPNDPVTRQAMAAFLIRALHEPGYLPPAPMQQRFQDVLPDNLFYAHIEEMAVRGITLGCSATPPLYCPSDTVRRDQMAAFLVRAFGL